MALGSASGDVSLLVRVSRNLAWLGLAWLGSAVLLIVACSMTLSPDYFPLPSPWSTRANKTQTC